MLGYQKLKAFNILDKVLFWVEKGYHLWKTSLVGPNGILVLKKQEEQGIPNLKDEQMC